MVVARGGVDYGLVERPQGIVGLWRIVFRS